MANLSKKLFFSVSGRDFEASFSARRQKNVQTHCLLTSAHLDTGTAKGVLKKIKITRNTLVITCQQFLQPRCGSKRTPIWPRPLGFTMAPGKRESSFELAWVPRLHWPISWHFKQPSHWKATPWIPTSSQPCSCPKLKAPGQQGGTGA